MAKPIIKNMSVFDANEGGIVNFIWTGNMAYNNRMYIYDANTQLLVYEDDNPAEPRKLSHEIPGGVLTNGKKYAVQIQVIDKNNIPSELSDKYYFWVMETPEFYFEGLSTVDPDLNMIDNSIYTATLHYYQSNGELLTDYQFFLYTAAREQIDTSGVIKDTSLMRFVYRSLDSGNHYYFRATGVTKNGIALDTGYVSVNVYYKNPQQYASMTATLNDRIGAVEYASNVVDIESDDPTEDYIYEDGYVDLTQGIYNRTMNITVGAQLNTKPSVKIAWTNMDNETLESDAPTVLENYKSVEMIYVYGNTTMVEYPQLISSDYRAGYYEVATQCWFGINGEVYNCGIARSLPNGKRDELRVDSEGNITAIMRVDERRVHGLEPIVKTEFIRNRYGRTVPILYFDIGASGKDGESNLYCNALPVGKDSRSGSFVFLDSSGLLGICLDYAEVNIQQDSISAVINWIGAHEVKVVYPMNVEEILIVPKSVQLLPISKMLRNTVRYSTNFVVPASSALFALQMKKIHKECEVLRVKTRNTDVFKVESILYENSLRFKLTVFGSISNQIIYSDPIVCDDDSIVTLYIKRAGKPVGGDKYDIDYILYDMYVFCNNSFS